MDAKLTVGQVAKLTGLSTKSIRYYEKEKLIPKAARSHSGYRLYPPSIVERLEFIRKAKAIGFHLDDVRKILELTDRGMPCCEKVFDWSGKRLEELDEQIRFLSGLREKLFRYRAEWKKQATDKIKMPQKEICDLIASVKLPKKGDS